MSKTILIDGETLENKGSMFLKPDSVKGLFRCTLILFIALFISIVFSFILTARLKNTTNYYNAEMVKVSDSLNCVIDSISTESEVRILHAEIGRLSIKKTDFEIPDQNDVYDFAKELGVWYPEILTAQAIVESSCGKHTPAKSNNLFGMKVPSRRETTANNRGSGDVYAKYGNWKLCVADRALWELHRFSGKKPTKEAYLDALSSYAEDENYIEKIVNIASKIH